MTKKFKQTSKRQTLHQQHKIEKKVKAHHKKKNKEAALNHFKKPKKDPGIPNLWPLKEKFIEKLQLQKEKLEEEQAKQKVARKSAAANARKKQARGLAGLAAEASSKSEEFEQKQSEKKEEENGSKLPSSLLYKDGSKKAYFKEFKKIVETADVILEVLDARDPLGCRCPDIERKILAKDPNKKIIFVLNKIDLIPKDNVDQWLKFLRNEFPTIAFKCSTQQQRSNLGQISQSTTKELSKHALESTECLGAENLLQLLKNYARNINIKTSVVVGIIGYPNVGKSSLINSLKRTRAVGVGSTPGFTKVVQEIHLDKNIKLLDCPGIVFGNSTNSDNDIILRNCVKIEQIPDPIEPVETIIKRAKATQLMEIYEIGKFNTTSEFLLQIALKKGKLGKGGVADIKAAARSVLQDWNAGKIPFYTIPPKVNNVHIASEIVSEWGKQFDINTIIDSENQILSNLSNANNNNMMSLEAGAADNMDMMNDEEENMDQEDEDDEDAEVGEEEEEEDDDEEEGSDMEDELPPQILETKKQKKDQLQKVIKVQHYLDPEEAKVNPQINKKKKEELKKLKKQNKKVGKWSNDMNSGDSYDFNDYFGADNGEEDEDEERGVDMEDEEGDLKLSDI